MLLYMLIEQQVNKPSIVKAEHTVPSECVGMARPILFFLLYPKEYIFEIKRKMRFQLYFLIFTPRRAKQLTT